MIISYKEKCAIIFIHPVHLSMQKKVQLSPKLFSGFG